MLFITYWYEFIWKSEEVSPLFIAFKRKMITRIKHCNLGGRDLDINGAKN